MNIQELMNASMSIARSNLSEKVVAVTVSWDDNTSRLTVIYYVDGVVSDNEQELCELTLTELLAEFSDVKLADSKCLSAPPKPSELRKLKDLIYLRA